MNVKLAGRHLEELRALLPEFGLVENDRDFALVICYGGDGALLGAEREHPGVPKLPLRDAGKTTQCLRHALRQRLELWTSGGYKTTRLEKLAGSVRGETLFALNDVFIHNADPASALRYRVRIDGKLYADEVVGDGAGLATVHGSSAYYRSITHSVFRVGIGLAFSNSTEEVSHLVLDASAVVELEIIRGPGVMVADNSPVRPKLQEGDRVTLRQSGKFAEIIGLEAFMCPECQKLRHPSKRFLPPQ